MYEQQSLLTADLDEIIDATGHNDAQPQEQAQKAPAVTSPYYHGKLDALLDRYARRLAQWTNDYNRNGASCPSILVSGGSNFPVKKKQRQNAREDSLWQEYKEIEAILHKIKTVGSGPVDLADPHARQAGKLIVGHGLLRPGIGALDGGVILGGGFIAHTREALQGLVLAVVGVHGLAGVQPVL